MKVQFDQISILGTSRTIKFHEGLNIVYGPISTGKSSVLRLCRIILGSAIGSSLPPEVLAASGIGAAVVIDELKLNIVRQLVSTSNAPVEVSGEGVNDRFPAMKSSRLNQMTFGQFLLTKLELPQIEVPSAPTIADSDPTPVSINDYMNYCEIPKEEMRSDVFGHRNPFKNTKRRYVFEILFGQYDVRTAKIQEDLRRVRHLLYELRSDSDSFERLLQGTAWRNRARLERELTELGAQQKELIAREETIGALSRRSGRSLEIENRLARIDSKLSEMTLSLTREQEDVKRFDRLTGQIKTQLARLTRAIVANETLVDFEFVVCPRCGTSLPEQASTSGVCYLCHQVPQPSYTKNDMIAEHRRLDEQLAETEELLESRVGKVEQLTVAITELGRQRESVSNELEDVKRRFISDSSEEIRAIAYRRAEIRERIRRLRDYLKLYDRRDEIVGNIDKLSREERDLIEALEEAKVRREDVQARIRRLEEVFTTLLRNLRLPEFLKNPVGTIDRDTYLPKVNGRRFEELQSEGLTVEVNIAHALAHHLVAMELRHPLPGILLIDGISGPFGEAGFDPERARAIYRQLIEICGRFKKEFQVIVADTRLPDEAKQFVCLELTEHDRLIPQADLEALQQQRTEK